MDAPHVLHGVDFSSAPTRRKPIVVATGQVDATRPDTVRLQDFTLLPTLDDFAVWLSHPGPWTAAFDLPFGLPRELVDAQGWPGHGRDRAPHPWARLIGHIAGQTRAELRTVFRAWCDARPPGHKFAHRDCDRVAGSSPSMKWVNPPVAWMLHAGTPRLLQSRAHLPGLHAGDPRRVALEAYPGHLARAVLGRRSYKSDTASMQTAERHAARADLLDALLAGEHPLGIRLAAEPALHRRMTEDGTADLLDAAICLLQAAWAWQRRESGWGLPAVVDPVEGWIAGIPPGG